MSDPLRPRRGTAVASSAAPSFFFSKEWRPTSGGRGSSSVPFQRTNHRPSSEHRKRNISDSANRLSSLIDGGRRGGDNASVTSGFTNSSTVVTHENMAEVGMQQHHLVRLTPIGLVSAQFYFSRPYPFLCQERRMYNTLFDLPHM